MAIRGQVLSQEGQSAKSGIAPDFVFKAVSDAWVNLKLIGNALALEHLLQMVGLFDRDRLIGVAVQNQHGTETAHEELHFLWQAAKKFHHRLNTWVDGGVRESEVSAKGKSQESDAFRIDLWLSRNEADPVPQSFHPERKVAKNRGLVDHAPGARPIKVVQHVDRKALLRQKSGGFGHGGVPAPGTMQTDDCGESLALDRWQEAVDCDRLAAAFEGELRLGNGVHGLQLAW